MCVCMCVCVQQVGMLKRSNGENWPCRRPAVQMAYLGSSFGIAETATARTSLFQLFIEFLILYNIIF